METSMCGPHRQIDRCGESGLAAFRAIPVTQACCERVFRRSRRSCNRRSLERHAGCVAASECKIWSGPEALQRPSL